MKTARLVLAFAFLTGLLVPRAADAHVGWWDWLEELSGPGPFTRGYIVDVRLFCLTKTDALGSTAVAADPDELKTSFYFSRPNTDDRLACLANRTVYKRPGPGQPPTHRVSVAGYVDVRFGRAWSEPDTPLFQDRPNELVGTVSATMLQAFLMRQVDPAVAVGVGGGALWFSGKQVTEKPVVGVVTPISVAFMPLKFLGESRKGSGFITLRFDEMLIMQSLDAHSFNSRSRSAFQADKDLISSFSITFDVLALK